MFTPSQIQACFDGLVGFFQPDDPSYSFVDADLANSSSGLYVNHPLCALETLYNIAPDFKSFNYPSWSESGNYNFRARVIAGGKIYERITSTGTPLNPATDTTNWKIVDPFSEWLRRQYRQACNNLMTTIISEKNLTSSAKSLLESQPLYMGWGMATDKIIKKDRFLGLEIKVDSADGIVFQINRVGLQADTLQTIPFYLYNTDSDEAIATFDLSVDKINRFSWQDLTNIVMNSAIADPGSRWFFGYYESDVEGQIVGKSMNISNRPCLGCDGENLNAYNRWSQYTQIHAIEVPAASLSDDKSLFDVSAVTRANTSNYGLNLVLSVVCDLSDIACRNRMILADALRMQIGIDLLIQIGLNTRLNFISDKVRAQAISELDDDPDSGSYKAIYLKAIRKANLDLSGLNSSCLPCSPKSRIRHSAL